MFKFQVLNNDSQTKARTGLLKTPHGDIQTPIFMPVGTLGSVKGVSPDELNLVGSQIILANTYHLFLRPGHQLVRKMGGLHRWTTWEKPMLTDSGGFQIFSLGHGNKKGSNRVKLTEDGVEFKSHLDGRLHYLTPEKVMDIETDLGADIIMALDECAPPDSNKKYAEEALDRTHRWVKRCVTRHQELENQKTALHPDHPDFRPPQTMFPIIQGTVFEDLRIKATQFISSLDTVGLAIGGLSVGETRETMYHILDIMHPHYPTEKPRYLMGVGTPNDIFESVERGVDMFDCVHATRIARHGCFYNSEGRHQIKREEYRDDHLPLDPEDPLNPTAKFSRSYIRHLVKENEMLGLRLLTLNNLYFLLKMMTGIRESINNQQFSEFKKNFFSRFHDSV